MAVVRVGDFASHVEAELARGMLDAHGLRAQVSDTSATIYGGRRTLGGGHALLVDEDDVPEVQRLLAEVAADDTGGVPDPHQSPFTPPTHSRRGSRARRILTAAVVAYGAVRGVEWLLG
jgi:hypothetical protein